jgi:bifunctional DNase/RNase
MIEAVVESIRVSLVTQHRVVVLREVDGDRHLPIWIGPFEAEAIAMVLQGVGSARPLPYDLLTSVVTELGATVVSIIVNDLSQDVFYARIILNYAGSEVPIDSRPSDAIALAVRAKIPILVDESVMDRAGIRLGDDEEDTEGRARMTDEMGQPVDEEQLSAFRDFIDSLDLDDFGKPRSG